MMKTSIALFLSFFMLNCSQSNKVQEMDNTKSYETIANNDSLATAVFASGCFWCVEAIYESVLGVQEAVSGYAGGDAASATYNKVSSGVTDHAEAVQVFYNPDIITYEQLLQVFFSSHDPTTLNAQGPDRGRQYRSTIFFKDEAEKATAQAYIDKLKADGVYDKEITTTLEPLDKFYPAEEYHQDFEKNNPNNPYVRSVSIPRLERFKQKMPEILKENK